MIRDRRIANAALAAAVFAVTAAGSATARAQGLSAPATTGGGAGTPASAPIAAAGAAAPVPPGDVSPDYRLDTGDTVRVDIQKHPDVSETFTLYADASLRMKRLDAPVEARGLTCRQLAEAIHKAYNKPSLFRLRPGSVTVTLTGARTRRIYVRGNAVKGGDFNLLNGWRITELVAVLGGVPQPDRVRVRITNPARPEPIVVNLEEALKDPASPANVALLEDDTLAVDGPNKKVLFVDAEGLRGQHEVDERFTLRQALIQMNVSTSNNGNDLTQAVIQRRTVAGDPTSPTKDIPVNLIDVLGDKRDLALQDYDTLKIPVSLRFYYVWGELGGPRKRFMPLDRKTYLLDVMADSGNTTGEAKIGDIQISRQTTEGKVTVLKADYGKLVKTGRTFDEKLNPEILPEDIVLVGRVRRIDPVNTFWQGFGLFNAIRTFIPGL